MSKTVNLTIDGKKVQAPEGSNLIDAAESAGIHIPNLCYLKGMRGIGACRLCLVEVEGGKGPVVGCITKVKDGMVVNTASAEIQETRKFIIDLILSMHPLDCMTCTKAGVCSLQQYAYDFEIKESSLTRKKFGYPIDEANPFIKRDPDYCILCARCVRVCREQGTNVLDFMGRGVGAKVVTAMDKPLQESDCTFCGSCVDACPVNALLEADRWRKGREWDYTTDTSVCMSCGNGCDIVVSSKDGGIVKISAGAEEGSATKYICAVGRFGFDANSSDARVLTPMKNVNGTLQETTWKDALEIVSGKLKAGGGKTGIISTGSILNQDALTLSRLATDVIKTKNVDTTVSLYADQSSMKHSDSADLNSADVIVIAGLNPSQWERVLPALDAGIRRRVSRGAKLIAFNSGETRIASAAAVSVQGDEAASLAQLAKALIDKGGKAPKELQTVVSKLNVSEDFVKAAEIVAGASSPVLFCSPSLFDAACNLSLVSAVKVIAVPAEANARGVMAMGLVTGGKTYGEMIQGGLDVLYAVGEVPVTRKPASGFLIVQTSYMTELAKQADVVLPAATFLESEGTMTNYLGEDKSVRSVVRPPAETRQHRDIFFELSKVMGSALKETAEIKSAREVAERKYHPFSKKQELDTDTAGIMEQSNASVINHSRLLWLKEAQKATA